MPSRHLLSGYLGTEPARDAVVVHAARAPRVVRKARLGPLGLCVLEGGRLDATPLGSPAPGGLVVGYLVDGEIAVEQPGHTTRLRPGEFVVYETASPFRVRADRPHRYMVLGLPLPATRTVATRCAGERPSAPLLTALLHGLADQTDPVPPASAALIGEATAACLHAVLLEGAPATGALFDRLTRWIDAHLADADLTAEMVARHNFLSARYVRRIFAAEGTTVSGHVRDRRLDRIRHDLLDPAQAGRCVSAIAANWGLREPSGFGRVFSRRFGDSPERYRRARLPSATSER
ncbi:helix-turn-helix domain-containing protein [Amycolatopsis sp. MtRt-6]|uniref:helix-turn-helix domain-containing protein n=1 Tax=Amycolatopsis sp. MtRt-6 TaxID=2792782 RepID=UPI001A8C8AB3|nr:helix-turn-helix domain-containing protein [Amycolatopsis sp. MtRt-6]